MLKIAVLVLKLILTALLLWYAASKVDLRSSLSTASSVSSTSLAAVMLIFALQFCLAALRFRGILRALGTPASFGSALDAIMVGAFFSQAFISFVGGDMMRVWRLSRSGAPMGVVAKGVVLDRAAAFAGLVVLLLVATPFIVGMITYEMLWGLLVVLLIAPAAIAAAFFLRRLPERLHRFKLLMLARNLTDDALAIWRTRQGIGHLLWLSIAIQLSNVMALYALASGLGLPLRFLDALLLLPAVIFLSTLPISFAGWGVREGAMIAALSLVGIASYQSLALSVTFGLSVLAVSLPGGVVWLVSRKPSR